MKKMNPRVEQVKPMKGYRLRLVFTNGETGIYNCAPLLDFGVFKDLKEESYFRRACVREGTVAWPHEQDIDPDTLYEESRRSRSASRVRPVGDLGRGR